MARRTPPPPPLPVAVAVAPPVPPAPEAAPEAGGQEDLLRLQVAELARERLQLALQLLLLRDGRIALLHCVCLGRPGSGSLRLRVGLGRIEGRRQDGRRRECD